MQRILSVFFLTIIAVCGASSSVTARPVVKLSARFSPDKPGASTTIHLGFTVGMTSGTIPPPATSVSISLPARLGVVPTTLGQVVCEQSALEILGEGGCPPNALMGRGSALVELAFGPNVVRDAANIDIFMGSPIHKRTTMILLATSDTPIFAEMIFHSILLSDPRSPDGAILETLVPPILSVPGAPNASVVSMQSTLGPENITYYHRVHGDKKAFTPEGLTLPTDCPVGGYRFAVRLTFADGTISKARHVVPCVSARTHKRHHN